MMMKEIKIQNFKCFTDFKASSFKRVNLITGTNNSGKTALLEAIYLLHATNDKNSFIDVFKNILKNRMTQYKDMIYGLSQDEIEISSRKKSLVFQIDETFSEVNITIGEAGEALHSFAFLDGLSEEVEAVQLLYNSNIVFLPSKTIMPTELADIYSVVQRNKKNKELIEFLSKIDNRIQGIQVSADSKVIILDVDGMDKMINASELGEGTKHFIALFSTLLKAENGILLIDEIENGIHYTKLPVLWDLILDISKKLNIQVFVATHADEVISALYNAAYRRKEKDIALCFLGRNEYRGKSGNIFDYEMIQNAVGDSGNLRGW